MSQSGKYDLLRAAQRLIYLRTSACDRGIVWLSPKQGACKYSMRNWVSSLPPPQRPQSSPCRTQRPSRARQRNSKRQIRDSDQTHQDQLFPRSVKSFRHVMVHSTARTHFGKVSGHVVKPIDRLNIKQEGTRLSLLGGQRWKWVTNYYIRTQHSS
jgi:hypothetical protein